MGLRQYPIFKEDKLTREQKSVPGWTSAPFMPWTVTDPWKAAGAVAAVVLLNAVPAMTLYVRGVNGYGAPHCRGRCSPSGRTWVSPSAFVVGAAACWLNARGSRRQATTQDPRDIGKQLRGERGTIIH